MALTRKLLSLCLATALLVAQWAGHVHALSHAGHDLLVTKWSQTHVHLHGYAGHPLEGDGRCDADHAPALDHGEDRCIPFLAIGAAACSTSIAVLPCVSPPVLAAARAGLFVPRHFTPFSSRAPPFS
jgi:hypothetical protein